MWSTLSQLFVRGLVLAVIFGGLAGCSRFEMFAGPQAAVRKARWAVAVHKPGLVNFYRIDRNLYRGSTPTPEGLGQLKAIGVKTIVSLRILPPSRREMGDGDFDYQVMMMTPWRVDEHEVVDFLKIATDPQKMPVFVYCYTGSDRTGLMCAVYRVVVQGWSREEAIEEMAQGGFGYHPVWDAMERYVRDFDVERIRQEAGLGVPLAEWFVQPPPAAPMTAPSPAAPELAPAPTQLAADKSHLPVAPPVPDAPPAGRSVAYAGPRN